MTSRFLLFSTITAFVITLVSCSDFEFPLFYTLENEYQLGDNALENTLAANAMVLFDGDYYLAAGSVYRVDADDNKKFITDGSKGVWKKDDRFPDGYNSYELVELQGTIYAIFYKPQDLSESALYKKTSSSSGWKKVSGQPVKFSSLATDDDYLYLIGFEYSGGKRDTYIYASDGSAFEELKSLGTYSSYADFSAANDTSNSYLAYGPEVYQVSGASLAALSLVSVTAGGMDKQIMSSLHYSTVFGNRLYLATTTSDKKGKIWYWNGSDWQADGSISERPQGFGDYDYDAKKAILIGTANGYLEKKSSTADFTTPALTISSDSYSVLDLSSAEITGFFVDSSRKSLFGLTNGNGLWSNREKVWNLE